MAVKPIPDGYHAVTPYLTVPKVAQVIEFLKKTFGATSAECHTTPDGRIMHAEVRIGDSVVMLGEPHTPDAARPANLYVYVADVDATYKRAVAAGGKTVMEPANQFYGDRHAGVLDSAGNQWWIATRVEDVSPDELNRRAQEYARKHAKA
jgi:PhnB protein